MDDAQGPGRAEGEGSIGIRAGIRARLVLSFVVAALAAATALAQGEAQRRLGAQLLVMAGDARRVGASNEPPKVREGIRARLAGALSALPMLLREAGAPDAGRVGEARAALERGQWGALERVLGQLAARHPLDLSHILPARATPGRLRAGRAVHREACAGCHDAPAGSAMLPAADLFRLARSVPAEEFAARLIDGVRGDASTGHRNPFGDLEIAALVAYYTNGIR